MKTALGCVRKANFALAEVISNEPLLLAEERRRELGRVRVELSVAAGKLADALDEAETRGLRASLARVVIAVCFAPVALLAALRAAAREAHLKRKLGARYEGPLED
jgi:hypothetical protein